MSTSAARAGHLALVRPTSTSKSPFLHRRGPRYYFKRKVPADCRELFGGQRQLWKSLGTDQLEKAKVMLAVEVTEFDLAVARHRRERAACAAGVVPLRHALSNAPTVPASEPRGDATSASLAHMDVLKAIETAFERLRGLMAPQVPLAPTAVSKPVPAHSTVLANQQPATSGPQRGRIQPTLLHLFEDWKRKQARPRTIGAVQKAVLEFHELHGALSIETINRQHARDYRDALIERRLSDGTIENRIGFLSTLVRHGQLEMVEHVLANPFERIEIYGGQGLRTPKDRRAFDVGELNLIYASRLYTQNDRPQGQCAEAAYWAPLMGPLVGARIEEVAQLRIEDIQRINGSWSLRICDLGDDQTIKTPGSFRRVPLHDALVQLGFLKYAAEQARAGAGRVFPSLSNDNANRIWSNALGKWWNRYIDGIGLSDSRLDYHSFRYTFRQQCSLCGIENETRDALTGHWVSNNDSGRTYMKAENRQYPYPKLVEAMKSLRYDELQVSHLFVEEPMAGVEEALLR
ncbi:site-specific integrase [Rhizobacter sp. SG703]|uniref:site-specific integrase n=1 Tax=Rhizobacter sp. SG703 TaxID=2587140 RepID=UPI0014451811|nr:site-specific integrase [Rhizobacter sp. SG703]NKI93491.1 integrase [Rhizobacter sp. SG703]